MQERGRGAPRQTRAARRPMWLMFALSFFMADFQAGVGPFLGVYLKRHGWEAGLIGTALTIGGVVGMALTTPAGALVDATRRKRLLVVAACVCVCAGSGLILLSHSFAMIAASQALTALGAAALLPALAGLTLGIVRQRGFNRQNSLNQAFNHAGNVAGAALSGLVGWIWGFPAIVVLSVAFALLAVAATLAIPEAAIDHAASRGMRGDDAQAPISGLAAALESPPLLALAAALLAFHLGNAAMLPLYGLAGAHAGVDDPLAFVAVTIVVAQVVMIAASLVALRLSERHGYWLVLLVSFVALPIRGMVAAYSGGWWGVFPVQALDGVGAGLQSVAVPGLVAAVLDGSGRINTGQGAVLTAQNVGAAVSPLIGGWIAQELGYSAAFAILGAFALVSIAVWVWRLRDLRGYGRSPD